MERNNKGQFLKGTIPWNKGKRGYMGANRTSFTSERVEQERTKYRLGEAHSPDKRDGYLSCRIEERVAHKDSRTGKIYYHRKRISYCRNLLKSMGINVPNGYVVYHIDGNTSNNDISNLEVISRSELVKRNTRGK